MNKKLAIILLVCIGVSVFAITNDLSFEGWTAWGSITATVKGNTVTLSGKADVAGYVCENLNPALKNRTVILEIKNIGNSTFSDGRLLKITANKDDRLIRPVNVTNLVYKEYVPVSVTRIEFTLPLDFDGKLGFVFYQAELKDLKITATYK